MDLVAVVAIVAGGIVGASLSYSLVGVARAGYVLAAGPAVCIEVDDFPVLERIEIDRAVVPLDRISVEDVFLTRQLARDR